MRKRAAEEVRLKLFIGGDVVLADDPYRHFPEELKGLPECLRVILRLAVWSGHRRRSGQAMRRRSPRTFRTETKELGYDMLWQGEPEGQG